MGQVSKLGFNRFAIADVATDSAVAPEAAGFVEGRDAARAQPGIALGPAAQILDIAERNMRLEDLPMGLDHLRIDARCHEFATGLAVVPLGRNPDQLLDVRGEPSEPVLRIRLPEPVRGGHREIAKALFAQAQGLLGVAAGRDVDPGADSARDVAGGIRIGAALTSSS